MSAGFPYCEDKNIKRLVRDFCTASQLQMTSCVDVGCGRSRADQWFMRSELSAEPRQYIGLELDPEIRGELIAAGVDARDPFSPEGKAASGDLCLALEVIEHIEPSAVGSFLSEQLARTRSLLALTTPNCEYWNGRRPSEGYEDLRFIPDHFLDLTPLTHRKDSPHSHKQAFTPKSLAEALAASLPTPSWRFKVYRAWPWTITDGPRAKTFALYYKLFALAWPTGA